MPCATSAAPVMNPNAAAKSANSYTRCSLPPLSFHPGNFNSATASFALLNFPDLDLSNVSPGVRI